MRIDRFTNQLQNALSDAQSLAVGKDHNSIDPLHLLSALLDQVNGSVQPLMRQAGGNIPALKDTLGQAMSNLPTVSGTVGDIRMSNDLARVLNLADKQSQQNNDAYLSCEVVAMALLDANIAVSKLLTDSGVSKQALGSAIESVRGGESVNDPAAEENRQALDKYTIDLTERAEQ